MTDTWNGPVAYLDGWHWSVVTDAAGVESLADKLYLEDDGTFRLAVDGDASWQDRKFVRYAMIVPEDGQPGISVSADELAFVTEQLAQRRAEQSGGAS